MALTKKQIKQLKALAHHLNPIIQVGKNDLSDAAVKQADETIEKRELIKCDVLDGSGLTAKERAVPRLAPRRYREDQARPRLNRPYMIPAGGDATRTMRMGRTAANAVRYGYGVHTLSCASSLRMASILP